MSVDFKRGKGSCTGRTVETAMKQLTRRILALIPAITLQIVWITVLSKWLQPFSAWIHMALSIVAFLLVIYIMAKREEGAYKNLWLLVILTFPVPGALLYLFFGNQRTARPLGKKLERASVSLPAPAFSDEQTLKKLRQEDLRAAESFEYVRKKTGFPVSENHGAVYYPLGEAMWSDMLEALKQAKQFIYAEFFIVENGIMLDAMIEIMAQKAAQGVDVRLMYDDFGSITDFSVRDAEKLRKRGIRCVPFNPLIFLRGTANNRDHRKMLIIDGTTAFSGGINLADEYINRKQRFGHWKDIGFKISGEAVHNYVRMFVHFWNAFSGSLIPQKYVEMPALPQSDEPDGYVLSYSDSPLQRDGVSNNLYIDLLSQTKEYIWFYTPYLLPGELLTDALVRTAQRGVDVRIIMPGIPDKKLVFRLSRSYYRELLQAGVRIFEYTPGFVHAKACLSDGKIGTVGTVNLDYRSLFLHFENNSLFYGSKLLHALKSDFLDTQSKCHEVTADELKRGPWSILLDGILRIFAPLC